MQDIYARAGCYALMLMVILWSHSFWHSLMTAGNGCSLALALFSVCPRVPGRVWMALIWLINHQSSGSVRHQVLSGCPAPCAVSRPGALRGDGGAHSHALVGRLRDRGRAHRAPVPAAC
eukprot:scaffold31179_cov101-Isochrysis_galbana.AAC.4